MAPKVLDTRKVVEEEEFSQVAPYHSVETFQMQRVCEARYQDTLAGKLCTSS